jgi:hypothetical protein
MVRSNRETIASSDNEDSAPCTPDLRGSRNSGSARQIQPDSGDVFMSTALSTEKIAQLLPSKSSVLIRVPETLRHEVNRAIIHRDPVTYEGVYQKFELNSLGVSYTAFYYYARRIRMAAALTELSKLGGDAHAIIPQAVSQTLLETVLDHSASSKTISKIAHVYRQIEMTRIARRRLEFDEADREEAKRDTQIDPDADFAARAAFLKRLSALTDSTSSPEKAAT